MCVWMCCKAPRSFMKNKIYKRRQYTYVVVNHIWPPYNNSKTLRLEAHLFNGVKNQADPKGFSMEFNYVFGTDLQIIPFKCYLMLKRKKKKTEWKRKEWPQETEENFTLSYNFSSDIVELMLSRCFQFKWNKSSTIFFYACVCNFVDLYLFSSFFLSFSVSYPI